MKKSTKQLSISELQEDVDKHLQTLVYNTSVHMLLSGFYSTNPLKGVPYLYSKFKKARAKK